MSEKLRDYQVLDVLCGGTFYKVKHKVTNNIFAWKAFDCSVYSGEQTQNIISDVKAINKSPSPDLIRYYSTILHAPSKTLYFVLEYVSWRNVEELMVICKATDKYVIESFIWYFLYELTRISKAVEEFSLKVLKKCISASSVFINDDGALRVNCFDLCSTLAARPDIMRQVGEVLHTMCNFTQNKIKNLHYSDDLQDVVGFLLDSKNSHLRPDVILYHPTVLANLETTTTKHLSEILVSSSFMYKGNKCDSEKAVELCRAETPPRCGSTAFDSPTYMNIASKELQCISYSSPESPIAPVSPTIAALALELPGFVPRSRQPLPDSLASCNSPQMVSECTLSQQWMSRLIALRKREESLNKRERKLISKEMINSPANKMIPFIDSNDGEDASTEFNGITLPSILNTAQEEHRRQSVTRRHRRSSSAKRRPRKSYVDLDSSLSADQGDGSIIVTATKFTKETMPRRNIFPEVSSKKVHFTAANPFVESDESVTLTFYELENIDMEGYQVPKQSSSGAKGRDINKFKYLDVEKVALEKRAAMQHWSQSSPPKQAKTAFADITNQPSIRRTPSKTSIASKTSNSSNSTSHSTDSGKSVWSTEAGNSKVSDNVSERTRASVRYSLAPTLESNEIKKPKSRKSLLNFKTPFKFMTSTRI